MPDRAVTRGAHHIGLTVPDLARTRVFFRDTLRFSQVGEVPDYPAVFLTDGTTMITLWQAKEPRHRGPLRPQERDRAASFRDEGRKRERARRAASHIARDRRRRDRIRAGAASWRADQAHDVRDPGRYPGRVHRSLTGSRSNPEDTQDSLAE